MPDAGEPARHEPDRRVPDHDGFVRVPDAGRQPAVHRERKYDRRTAIGLAIGGIPGVFLAAFVVKSLPLQWLYWLVVIVVLYAAILMLRSALQRASHAEPVASDVMERPQH